MSPGPKRSDRGNSRFDRRAARNRKVIIVMAVLMGLSVVAVPLGLAISSQDPAPPEDEEDPFAAPDESDEPDEPEETVGPCGPTPDDVPEVTSTRYDEPFPRTIEDGGDYELTLETTCGDIVIALDADGAPTAVNNLVNLAQDGYYDGVIFHRVTSNPPVIQGGDPAGTGCGREDCSAAAADEVAFPGYTIPDELGTAEEMGERLGDELLPRLREEFDALVEEGIDPEDIGLPADPSDEDLRALIPGGYERGTVAMANAGPDTAGSQFFIVHEDTPLPPLYTIVGTVTAGMEVVDDIAESPTQVAADASDRPYEPVVIRSATVREP